MEVNNMDKLTGFNIRVYAICVNEDKFLVLHENNYAGKKLCKLPGGGLEFGESTIECLKREFKEELNVTIEIIEHLYTQEEFIEPLVKENKQLFIVYYVVKILNISDLHINIPDIEKSEWIDFNKESPLTLPLDKKALNIFVQRGCSGNDAIYRLRL